MSASGAVQGLSRSQVSCHVCCSCSYSDISGVVNRISNRHFNGFPRSPCFFLLPTTRENKCKDTILSLYDLIGGKLDITPTRGTRYAGLPNRTIGEWNREGLV